nr:MAG TPA: hypothetical protein [Caudoviricetes sp.]
MHDVLTIRRYLKINGLLCTTSTAMIRGRR